MPYKNREDRLKWARTKYARDEHTRDLCRLRVAKRRKLVEKDGNPVKYKARRILYEAVRIGSIKRLPCKKCGNIKSQGHHADYSKPLNVIWLCPLHHAELHRKYK